MTSKPPLSGKKRNVRHIKNRPNKTKSKSTRINLSQIRTADATYNNYEPASCPPAQTWVCARKIPEPNKKDDDDCQHEKLSFNSPCTIRCLCECMCFDRSCSCAPVNDRNLQITHIWEEAVDKSIILNQKTKYSTRTSYTHGSKCWGAFLKQELIMNEFPALYPKLGVCEENS